MWAKDSAHGSEPQQVRQLSVPVKMHLDMHIAFSALFLFRFSCLLFLFFCFFFFRYFDSDFRSNADCWVGRTCIGSGVQRLGAAFFVPGGWQAAPTVLPPVRTRRPTRALHRGQQLCASLHLRERVSSVSHKLAKKNCGACRNFCGWVQLCKRTYEVWSLSGQRFLVQRRRALLVTTNLWCKTVMHCDISRDGDGYMYTSFCWFLQLIEVQTVWAL